MQEMAQVSNIPKQLQQDVSSFKSVQAKSSMNITNIHERLSEADGQLMDMEMENAQLGSELQKKSTGRSWSGLSKRQRTGISV